MSVETATPGDATASTMTETLVAALSAPIKAVMSTLQPTDTPPKATHPSSWICHDCVYLLPTQSAITNFDNTHCHGCGHERCGMCDIVYVEEDTKKNIKKVAVIDPNSGNADHMTFQVSTSDAEAAAKVVEESGTVL